MQSKYMYNFCLNTYLNYKVSKFTRENLSEKLKKTSEDSVNEITFTAKKSSRSNIFYQIHLNLQTYFQNGYQILVHFFTVNILQGQTLQSATFTANRKCACTEKNSNIKIWVI